MQFLLLPSIPIILYSNVIPLGVCLFRKQFADKLSVCEWNKKIACLSFPLSNHFRIVHWSPSSFRALVQQAADTPNRTFEEQLEWKFRGLPTISPVILTLPFDMENEEEEENIEKKRGKCQFLLHHSVFLVFLGLLPIPEHVNWQIVSQSHFLTLALQHFHMAHGIIVFSRNCCQL